LPKFGDFQFPITQVDEFIGKVKSKKALAIKNDCFMPWDFDARYSADPVIKRGKLAITDGVVFRTQAEALRCFGFSGKAWQRGGWIIPDGSNDVVWFPRLYQYGIWRNELTDEGKVLLEKATNKEAKDSIARQREKNSQYPDRKYIVFAKAKDALGFNLLRYVGTFKMNFDEIKDDVLRFDRWSSVENVRV